MAWIVENQVAIIATLFAISEGLSLIPSVQANGVFQALFGILKKLAGK